jgi:hypothetical protein
MEIVGQQGITTSPVDDVIKAESGSFPENQQLIKVKLGPVPPISSTFPTNRQPSTVTNPSSSL